MISCDAQEAPAGIPDSPETKRARAKTHYAANIEEQRFKAKLHIILKGKKPNAKTLAAYRRGECDVDRIHALDDTYRTVLEDNHGVDLRAVYANKTPLLPINLPRVQVAPAPGTVAATRSLCSGTRS
jgi:hypothetical protein